MRDDGAEHAPSRDKFIQPRVAKQANPLRFKTLQACCASSASWKPEKRARYRVAPSRVTFSVNAEARDNARPDLGVVEDHFGLALLVRRAKLDHPTGRGRLHCSLTFEIRHLGFRRDDDAGGEAILGLCFGLYLWPLSSSLTFEIRHLGLRHGEGAGWEAILVLGFSLELGFQL
jgi:hypothetical protein